MFQSARGLAQSKTWRILGWFMGSPDIVGRLEVGLPELAPPRNGGTYVTIHSEAPGFHAITHLASRSLRGAGTVALGRSASRGPVRPTSSASNRCCSRNASIIWGEAGGIWATA